MLEINYINLNIKKNKYDSGEKWNIYQFEDLLELENKIWFNEGEKKERGVTTVINLPTSDFCDKKS